MMYDAHTRIHCDPECPNIMFIPHHYTERVDEFMYNDIIENYFYDHNRYSNKYSLLRMRICYKCRNYQMRYLATSKGK